MDSMPAAAVSFFLLVAMTACAADPKPVVIVDKPVTVTIAVSEPLRKAGYILLQLEQVTTPKTASVTWNMFIELPSADARTSVNLPNFIGYVTTLPNPTAPANPPKGMTLQLPDAAARFVRILPEVRLTFVPTAKFAGDGVRIGFTQIAGLIARRIVPFVKTGDAVTVGQRVGLIRFGSRVDVYLPAGTASKVALGQRSVAGETILGMIGDNQSTIGLSQ